MEPMQVHVPPSPSGMTREDYLDGPAGMRSRSSRSSSYRCGTCDSIEDLEEDIDNRGMFYCKRCWEEYESITTFPDMGVPQEQEQRSPAEDRALWIVHDNQILGNQVRASREKKVKCLLETKEPGKKNCIRIIIGMVDYSGSVYASGFDREPIREIDGGTECLRLLDARGYLVDHNTVESRLSSNKSIYEFHLDANDSKLLTGPEATMSAKEFLRGCEESVDVIIDPQCSKSSTGEWFPQREASDGGVRKLPPLSRSKGVGYLRLGDDMSRNGTAFLSGNGCRTFFSSPSSTAHTSIATSAAPTNTSTSRSNQDDAGMSRGSTRRSLGSARRSLGSARRSSRPAPKSRQQTPSGAARGKDMRSKQRARQSVDFSDDEDDDDGILAELDCEPEDDTGDILKQLESEERLSYKDRKDLFTRLGKALAGKGWPKVQCSAALGFLERIVCGKNISPLVVGLAVLMVGDIGEGMGKALVGEGSWRPIMLGMLSILKDKKNGTVVKQTLDRLHGTCWTLANSLTYISHSLGLGRETAGSGRRATGTLTTRARMTSVDTRNGTKPEIIEWLAARVEAERQMADIEPMVNGSRLVTISNFFLSHAGHTRCQRCRRSVPEGLAQVVFYGIDRLGLTINDFKYMYSRLEEINPRGYTILLERVKSKDGTKGSSPKEARCAARYQTHKL